MMSPVGIEGELLRVAGTPSDQLAIRFRSR
jgi:hypothetical protein